MGDVEIHGIGERVSRRPCEKAREKILHMCTTKQWKDVKKDNWERVSRTKGNLTLSTTQTWNVKLH